MKRCTGYARVARPVSLFAPILAVIALLAACATTGPASRTATRPVPAESGAAATERAFREVWSLSGTHGLPITSTAMTPDGQFALSASGDGVINVWRFADGSLARTLRGHRASIEWIAVTPDGEHLVSGGRDSVVIVWRIADGTIVRTLRGHEGQVWGVSISPDGRFVLSASADRTARVWRLSDGALVRTFRGHEDNVNSAVMTPDGGTVVTGSKDETIRVWSMETGEQIRTIEGHEGSVLRVALTPDGARIVSFGRDRTVHVWRLADGGSIRTMKKPNDTIYMMALSLDGRYVAVTGDLSIVVFAIDDGSIAGTWPTEGSTVGISISPDGRFLLAGSGHRMGGKTTLVARRFAGGEIERTFGIPPATNFAVTPDWKRVVTWHPTDARLRVWRLADGRLERTIERFYPEARFTPSGFEGSPDASEHMLAGLHITADGERIVSTVMHSEPPAVASTAYVHRIADGELLQTIPIDSAMLFGATLTADGAHLVACSGTVTPPSVLHPLLRASARVTVHRLADGGLERTIAERNDGLFGSPSVSPDGQLVALIDGNTSLEIRRLADGAHVHRIETARNDTAFMPATVVFAQDGRSVIVRTAYRAGNAFRWGIARHGIDEGVPAAAFACDSTEGGPMLVLTGDGAHVATAAQSGAINIYRVADGRIESILRAPGDSAPMQAAVSADGRRMVLLSSALAVGETAIPGSVVPVIRLVEAP